MTRADLLALLAGYERRHPDERATVERIRRFVRAHEDCCERTCPEGHLTGSAWVVSGDGASVVLVHHRKLDRWLQPGGHADGEAALHAVALREAAEETGIDGLALVAGGSAPLPLDLDVHRIPARAGVAAHLHLDWRYLVRAPAGARPRASDESHDARWFPVDEALSLGGEEGLHRLARKAAARLEAAP